MYTNDVSTMAQPGATSVNVSIYFKELRGGSAATSSTGVGKALWIKWNLYKSWRNENNLRGTAQTYG